MPILYGTHIPTKEDITQLEQVQRRAARYVTNCYHNTSSISNMIEHLNWQTLADRRTDACLVMLYKITHELVAIPKTDILIPPVRFSWNMHSLSYQIPSTSWHMHKTQTAIILSANNTKLEQSPPEHCEEWLCWVIQISCLKSLTISHHKLLYIVFILKYKNKKIICFSFPNIC
jgi:hypothetical protein